MKIGIFWLNTMEENGNYGEGNSKKEENVENQLKSSEILADLKEKWVKGAITSVCFALFAHFALFLERWTTALSN